MLWTRKEKMHTETPSPVVVVELLQHSRMAGLIQKLPPFSSLTAGAEFIFSAVYLASGPL